MLRVDDDARFLEVAHEFLERADDRLAVTTVTDPRDILPAVADGDFHYVLSDYDMPHLDGLALFGRLREAGVELPFVLFTGKGSESIAAEAMSAGVTDYIQKAGTDTYEVVANRVLDAVRSRCRKVAVDHAVAQYTELIEAAHLPVYLYDEAGEIVYANEAAADLFGANDAESVVGLRFESVVPEQAYDAVESRLERVTDGQRAPQTQFRV
ncbi:MAG: response regulator [Haloferacaceae archaeon]